MKINNRIGIFADCTVGEMTIEFLLEHYFNDVAWIVCKDEESELLKIVEKYNFDKTNVYCNSQLNEENISAQLKHSNVNYILLAWWPYLIKEPILSIPKIGVLNFHPSLLPFNKGKHYNFWTIIEGTPFGVSIHFANEKIDSGDIIFQKEIYKDWLDTGETLYIKAQREMISLFIDKYPDIRLGNYTRTTQKPDTGTFHFAREIDAASEIVLDKEYKARELLNILRARTFVPYPAAWFQEDGVKYEIRVSITKE